MMGLEGRDGQAARRSYPVKTFVSFLISQDFNQDFKDDAGRLWVFGGVEWSEVATRPDLW